MHIDAARTVGDIAAELPASTRVFERLGIDYCCGGRRSLAAACARRGLALDGVLRDLETLGDATRPGEVRWSERPIAELVEHILATHHVFTRDELARAMGLARKVSAAHGPAHPELLVALDTFAALHAELLPHLEREEQVLFPYILELAAGGRPSACFPTVAMPVRVMDMQHEVAGDLLTTLRAQTRGYALPADACGSWRALWSSLEALEADLHQHIHLETNVLFPRALEAERAAPH